MVGLIYYGGTRRIEGLASMRPRSDTDLPLLTIVSAARNEERRVGGAVRTLLAQDYPKLHVIAVDDRSEDRTGAILDEIAASDGRLEVIHLTSLPEGWLGKCHALAVGAAAARGERDAQPGKILHEARGGEMAALGEVPFRRYYGSVDATPLFVLLAGAYYQRTGDLEFAAALRPHV
ncbi:MAG TPA: glycosyltransferase, partial [Candidatus Eisenbacteria bacterium]|nr:glycosyltransferase [Candidatus Eisenbacteria bacterium]